MTAGTPPEAAIPAGTSAPSSSETALPVAPEPASTTPEPAPAPEVPAEPEPALDLASLPPFSLASRGLMEAASAILSAPVRDMSVPDVATGVNAELARIDAETGRLTDQLLRDGQREFPAHREATFGPLRTWRDTGQHSEPCGRKWMTPEPEYVS